MSQPYPGENDWWNEFRDEVIDLLDSVSITFPDNYDWDAFKWWARTAYSIGAKMPAGEARTRHLRELEAELGIGPLPVDGGVPVGGYPDEGRDETVKSWWNDQRDAIVARYNHAGKPFPRNFNFGLFKWWARTAFDIGNDLPADASKSKHLRELSDALGIIVPVGPNRNRLHGIVTVNGWQSRDDTGPRVLMFCHFMEAFSLWCHGRQEEVRRQLKIIAERYGGIRVCDVLGFWDTNRPGDLVKWQAWLGREVTPIQFRSNGERWVPSTPSYWEQKRNFLIMLHSFGLKILDDRGDLNSWTREAKLEHMRINGTLYKDLGDVGKEVLAGLWSINESWQNGAGTNDGVDVQLLQQMHEKFANAAGWAPSIRGLSSPYDAEMPDALIAMAVSPATVITVHGNRGSYDHIIEHYFGYGYDGTIRRHGKKVFNTEPVGGGHGVSVGQVNDVEVLCGIHAAMLITGQASTFMSGNGVFYNGLIQDMPGFVEVSDLTRWIPQDAADFTQVVHAGNTFHGKRIMAAVDPTRFDCAIHADGRFMAVLHTAEGGNQALPCERACSEFRVIDMVHGAVERDGPMKVGETYLHNGKCRLVIGRLSK